MQKYQQYCPVARASEILSPIDGPRSSCASSILGSHRFNEIERGLPGISRSLLASRLRDLEDSGVVERLPGAQPTITEYHLSEAGRELKTVIETLGAWGVRWAFGDPRPEELDAGLLIWRIHQRINRELLPERRTVVEFDFTGPADDECGCCSSHARSRSASRPLASIPTSSSARIWRCSTVSGWDTSSTTRPFAGRWIVEGLPVLAKQLPRWFMWSPMARFVREREHTWRRPQTWPGIPIGAPCDAFRPAPCVRAISRSGFRLERPRNESGREIEQ